MDFKTEPWPKLSEAAKDCVRRLLDQDVPKRATAAQILKHDWLVKEGVALDIALDSVVLKRLKQFAQMNKLKKACLMVIGQHLTPDEIAGALRMMMRGWCGLMAGPPTSCKSGAGGATQAAPRAAAPRTERKARVCVHRQRRTPETGHGLQLEHARMLAQIWPAVVVAATTTRPSLPPACSRCTPSTTPATTTG